MSRKSWSEKFYTYLKEISIGRYNDEITEMMNKKFGTNFTEDQIKNAKTRRKIKSGVPKQKPNPDAGLFTKEQKDFIKKKVKGLLNQELADLVNKEFNLNVTAGQMLTYKKNHNLISGLNTTFQKGQDPWNKGMKGLQIGGKETQFKKGQQPKNYKPVGSERIDSKDGYTLIKVQDEGSWPERWRHKHVVLWESVNGPVPEGHVILFADGNKENITLDNLILISRRQLAVLNKNDLIQNNVDLTKAGIVIADLHLKINEKQREEER